ncbi:MAG TPA: hypothetical protein VMR34_02950 [Candidatus Saccharimonadales bacterium]|nr:hypothetical protein [Candidatus Saccharimonadales bacterium]
MEDLELTVERRRIGLELHDVESVIGIGKQAIREIVSTEPIDTPAVEIHRTQIHEARLRRNGLRSELNSVKAELNPLGEYQW